MSDKIYKIAVVALLAVIVLVQVIGLLDSRAELDVSSELDISAEECLDAVELAQLTYDLHFPNITELFEEYRAAAYDMADNINQQIFFAGEFQVMALSINGAMNAAMLNMAINCN